jgi:hypothetical protein
MKTELQQQFRLFLETGSASARHQHQLTSFQSHWRRLYSEDTCYSCMMRRPKYKLPCGHWVCDICMKIFGTMKNVYLYLENCLLCGGHGIRIRFKPDTATVRVLCIDGGGTRACVPLRFLQELEARVGLPYPVQYNFDILFGTSSGKFVHSNLATWKVPTSYRCDKYLWARRKGLVRERLHGDL